jgi:hypothetical protein
LPFSDARSAQTPEQHAGRAPPQTFPQLLQLRASHCRSKPSSVAVSQSSSRPLHVSTASPVVSEHPVAVAEAHSITPSVHESASGPSHGTPRPNPSSVLVSQLSSRPLQLSGRLQSAPHEHAVSPLSHVPSPQQGEQSTGHAPQASSQLPLGQVAEQSPGQVAFVSPPLQTPSPQQGEQSTAQAPQPSSQLPFPQHEGQSAGHVEHASLQMPSPQQGGSQSAGHPPQFSPGLHRPSPQQGGGQSVGQPPPQPSVHAPSPQQGEQSAGHAAQGSSQVPFGHVAEQSPGHDAFVSSPLQMPSPHAGPVSAPPSSAPPSFGGAFQLSEQPPSTRNASPILRRTITIAERDSPGPARP